MLEERSISMATGEMTVAAVAPSSLNVAKWVGRLLLSMALLASIVATSASARTHKHVGLPASRSVEAGEQKRTSHSRDLVGAVSRRVRHEYVDEIDERKLIENALRGMLSNLDPHSRYMNAEEWRDTLSEERGEYVGLGIQITQADAHVRVVSVIDDSPAARTGLKPGDLIKAVDGEDVMALSSAAAADRLLGALGSNVTLTIERQGVDESIAMMLTRTSIHLPTLTSRRYGGVGYIRLAEFNEVAEPNLRKALTRLQQQGNTLSGLVLDLRDNPGGLLEQAVAIADDFLVGGRIVSVDGRSSEEQGLWNARAKAHDIIDGLPLVVLINDGSASASEIVAGALQDRRRAVLVGTRSFGKGTGQTVFPLPDRLGAVILTTSRFYTPSGRAVQGIGIKPDIEISDRGSGTVPVRSEHEVDLRRVLPSKARKAELRQRPLDLSFVAGQITLRVPDTWPSYDPSNPATDFQLQQALTLAHAMAARKRNDGAFHSRPWRIGESTFQLGSGRAIPTTFLSLSDLRHHTEGRVSVYGLQDWWSMAAFEADRHWR